jgi:hypothetical protein
MSQQATASDLLRRHKFEGVDSFDITPVHAVTYGRR